MNAGDRPSARETILKRLLAGWRRLETVFDGIDDLDKGAQADLDNRVARLERDVAALRAAQHRSG
jgi:uncharacterized protein YceH (UPF0502 family)